MQLFFHDVGLKGANSDFPKTVFNSIDVGEIVEAAPIELRLSLQSELNNEFPTGLCNAWGVPHGASSVIRQLKKGDAVLLIKSTGGLEEIPALCLVKAFIREPMVGVSDLLWGSAHFPYVFFFQTEEIDLTWSQFKTDVQYQKNFRPSGNVYRVREDRFSQFGSASEYVKYLRNGNMPKVLEIDPKAEYAEGERKTREVSYFERNPKLVAEAKEIYGYVCQACGFDFQKAYGELGEGYIECHHQNPLSERDEPFDSTLDEVCVLCSNCHRMIHRTKPAMTLAKLIELIRAS